VLGKGKQFLLRYDTRRVANIYRKVPSSFLGMTPVVLLIYIEKSRQSLTSEKGKKKST